MHFPLHWSPQNEIKCLEKNTGFFNLASGKKIHAQITSRGHEIRYLEQQFWCQNHSVRISHSTAFINFLRRSQVVKDVAL